MSLRNDWISWSYNGVDFGTKTSPNDIFKIKFKKEITRPVKSYKEELLLNAQLVRDSFSEPLDILFSGGGDSEVLLRCYVESKIPVNVFIFKYENDYNIRDYTHAIRICNELNITPKVIDFNLKKFFENDAYDIWKIGYAGNAGRLPLLKMVDYLDNLPIRCDGLVVNARGIEKNNGSWKFIFKEICFCESVYFKTIGRTVISAWFDYSPEVLLSFVKKDTIVNLCNNKYDEISHFNTIKYRTAKELFPDFEIRDKLNGFEGNKPLGQESSKPDFMIDFNEKYIYGKVSNTDYTYTREELVEILE
jgi:hypothetical protein